MSALPSPQPVPPAGVLVARPAGAGHPGLRMARPRQRPPQPSDPPPSGTVLAGDVDRGGPSVLDLRLAPFLDALVDLLVTDLTRRPPGS